MLSLLREGFLMKITGIIAEYNPFHNGHIHHINKTKRNYRLWSLICTMSGHFVQRGEPAITTKWERAKTAIEKWRRFSSWAALCLCGAKCRLFCERRSWRIKISRCLQHLLWQWIKQSRNIGTIGWAWCQSGDAMKGGLSPVQAYEILYGYSMPMIF